jgi:hypothetical protein
MEARTPNDTRNQAKSYASQSPEGHLWQINLSTKQGHPRRKKVRAFCGPCNYGWMRSLQDEAKPILAPLILGNSAEIIQSPDIEVIAKWMTMTTMSGEFDHRETVSIPESQRRKFWETKRPQENWKIWIGRYRGNDWSTRYRHEGGKLHKANEPPANIHNTQNTAIVLGELFLYSVSSTADDLDKFEPSPAAFPEKHSLVQIWPQTNQIIWNDVPIIGDGDAIEIATWLSHMGENQGAGKFLEIVFADRCKNPVYLEREMTPTDQMISDWSDKFDKSHPELLLPAGSPIFPVCSSTSFTSSAVEHALISRLKKEEGTVVNVLMNPVMAARFAFQLLDILNQEGYFRVGLDIIHPTKDHVLTSLRPTNWTKKSGEQSS